MWIRRAPESLSSHVAGAARAWAAAAAGGSVLVVVLTVQTDIVHMVPPRYAPVVRVGVLVAAAIAGAITVHHVLDALFQRGSHRGALVAMQGVTTWVAYGLLALFLTSALGVNLSGFILGSEFVGLTRVRGPHGTYPAVEQLRRLAGEVHAGLGSGVSLVYAADWTEYGAHVREGGASVRFPLDPLFAETYDPLILPKWGTYGTRGDATKARDLYAKAEAGGIKEAKARFDALRR